MLLQQCKSIQVLVQEKPMIKSYRELICLHTFEERFDYLKLKGTVGESTFGFNRYLNQILYSSTEWKHLRNQLIIRDDGCDLGIIGREIFHRAVLHHINPITPNDLELNRRCLLDPNNLIITTHDTHNAIHYGDESLLTQLPQDRSKGDTCPWKVY